MNNFFIEEEYVVEYIKDNIHSLKRDLVCVKNARYHHNTKYRNAVSVCRNGILTMLDLHRYKIKTFSLDILKKFEDDCFHVNGINAVSLSVAGLNDLYKDEEEYNSFDSNRVDFLISSDVVALRNSTNYGNEFLSIGSIGIDKIKSVDIRLIELMNRIDNSSVSLVSKYNALRGIAYVIKKYQLDIPLREMSMGEEYSIDIDKLSKMPKLNIK